jgi:4-hydroxybenzoate polyprenyltransferase
LRRGKACFKRAVAEAAALDLASLPLRPSVLAYVEVWRRNGRELALYSSADDSQVQALAAQIGLFDHAEGSDGVVNLAGPRKLEAIRARYGDRFAYAGDARVDLPIWRCAKAAVVVGGRGLSRRVAALAPLEATFPASGGIKAWAKALRLHQWAKNLLLFVPVLLAGPLAGTGTYVTAGLGFLTFGFLASAGYVINDLLDLDADRRHRSKRHRPFAAGELPITHGVAATGLLLCLAIAGCTFLPSAFGLMAVVYFVGTLAYSLGLKRVPLLDVLVLAGLFTARVLAGAVLLPVPASFWLLTFSMFLFLSLALVKRYAELAEVAGEGGGTIESRGYTVEELLLLMVLGGSSAMAATVIFVVYLINEQFPSGLYREPRWLWLIFPILLYWLLRIWRLTVHGRMHDDPVLFALKDALSIGLGGAVFVLLVLAW